MSGPGARFLVGDVFGRLGDLADGSVDLVLTSPPFLALRSYLPDDHPDKGREVGGEVDPAGFLDSLLGLTVELDRVLAPHGSLCVELGDTYSGSGGAGGDYAKDGMRAGQNVFVGSRKRSEGGEWPLPKSLCGVPELFAFSLAYGRNLLTGEPCPSGRWRVRNTVAWCRSNPPVGRLGDKFRPAKSLITVACRGKSRWFDADAVRKVNADGSLGAPPLDWWSVPTVPYRGSHYAVWPPRLLTVPIEAMCPREVCRVCGVPRVRLKDDVRVMSGEVDPPWQQAKDLEQKYVRNFAQRGKMVRSTVGWSDCGHDDFRRGSVLDPFAGSGTTLMVANQRGRDAIGIDLDERNVVLARERVGDHLVVE